MRSTRTRSPVLLSNSQPRRIGRVRLITLAHTVPDITGRTGVWYFSTRRKVPSKDLIDHLHVLDALIAPFGDQDNRLKELREIMERRNLQAHVTFFWRGPPGAQHPTVPSVATDVMRRLPADIEPDFANEDC